MSSQAPGNCYLIADEVGLGKTRIAAGIVKKIKQNTGRARVIYVASNARIAAKNMEDFLSPRTAELKPFQKAAVNRAVGALGFDPAPATTKSFCDRDFPDNRPDRLSTFFNSPYCSQTTDKDSFVLSFSPMTSFLQPPKSESADLASAYSGNGDEQKWMLGTVDSMLETIQKRLDEKEVAPDEEVKESGHKSIRAALFHAMQWEVPKLKTVSDFQRDLKTLRAKLTEIIEKTPAGANSFPVIRRIFCNANALLLDPDVVVLDEIQRFRATLENCPDGYSILQMVTFLNAHRTTPVKVIMLSATPYRFNHRCLEDIWKPGEEGSSSARENPYEDFAALRATLAGYGADVAQPKFFLSRTERRFFYAEGENDLFRDAPAALLSGARYRAHVAYLTELLKTCPEQAALIAQWAECAPHFWRFGKGYEWFTKDLSAFANVAADPQHHLLLSALLDTALPNRAEQLLWVAPTAWQKEPGGAPPSPFAMHQKLGKTLVFTHYRVAAKSAAALLSEAANARLALSQLPPLLDVCGNHFAQGSVRQAVQQCIPGCGNACVDKVLDCLAAFFNTPYAKAAVYQSECRQFNAAAVEHYCTRGQFAAVLAEYRAIHAQKNDPEFAALLCAVLKPATVGKYDANNEYTAGTYYTDDPANDDGHDKDYQKNLIERFNSPFYPFVMAVTATAQEGLDFHYYADKIMHWEPAVNVNAFQQREGRVNRPMSLTMRRRYYDLCYDPAVPVSPRSFFEGMKDGQAAYDILQQKNPVLAEKAKPAFEAGLFPLWYIPAPDAGAARITRIAVAPGHTDLCNAFHKLKEGAKQYPAFLGAAATGTGQAELCPFPGASCPPLAPHP